MISSAVSQVLAPTTRCTRVGHVGRAPSCTRRRDASRRKSARPSAMVACLQHSTPAMVPTRVSVRVGSRDGHLSLAVVSKGIRTAVLRARSSATSRPRPQVPAADASRSVTAAFQKGSSRSLPVIVSELRSRTHSDMTAAQIRLLVGAKRWRVIADTASYCANTWLYRRGWLTMRWC